MKRKEEKEEMIIGVYCMNFSDLKNGYLSQLGHRQQTKLTILPKSSLTNQCSYWFYLQEQEWGVT